METDRDGFVEIDVVLAPDLLREIDQFAVHNGFDSPGAVVAAAVERAACGERS